MAKVFISYARKDKNEVYPIVDMLEKNGIDCWIDKNGIESGDEFENVIIKAINGSDIFIYMLSPNAIKSDWVKDEFEHAKHKAKTIIPICFSKLFDSEDDLDTAMFRFRRIDYIDTAIEGWQEKLLRAVKKYVSKDENLNESTKEDSKSATQNKQGSTTKRGSLNNYGVRPEFMQLIVSIVENYYMSRKNKGKKTFYDIQRGVEQLIKIDSNNLNLEEEDLKTYCIKIFTSSIRDSKPYSKEFNTEAYRILYTGEIKNVSDLSNYELYDGTGISVTPSQNFNLLKILDQIAQLGSLVPETLINKPVLCPSCHSNIVASNNQNETMAIRCSNPNCNYFIVTDTPHKSKQTHKYFSIDTKCSCSGGVYRLRHANFSDVYFQCYRCGNKKHPELYDYDTHKVEDSPNKEKGKSLSSSLNFGDIFKGFIK